VLKVKVKVKVKGHVIRALSWILGMSYSVIDGLVSVCLLPMAGRTAGSIKTKRGIGTHVDPRNVLGEVKVKVKVMWRHLANANKTPYRGPQGPREFEREAR